MITIADLLREQQATDVLITRAYRAQLGFALGRQNPVANAQFTLLHRMQKNANQRLEALVERMEKANATAKERREKEDALEESNPCTPDP